MAKKKPEHIAKYDALLKKARKIADTTEHEHSVAYSTAAEALLRDEEGNIDYELLENPDVQQQFADKMTDHYLSKANKLFKAKLKKEDVFQKDLLLRAYAGITKTELEHLIRTHGKKYTLPRHEEVKSELMKKIRQELHRTAASHLKEEHVTDLVRHMGIEDIVDASKMRIEDAASLYPLYKERGPLSEETIRDIYREQGVSPIFLKPKKKQADERAA